MWKLPGPIGEMESDEAWSLILRQLRAPTRFLKIRRELAASPEREGFKTLELLDGRTFEWHARPEWVGGVAIGRVSSFRDISEQRRAEALMAIEKRVLEMVVSGEPILTAMTELARQLKELSGQMFCAILFRDNETASHYSLAIGRGLPKSYAETLMKNPELIPIPCCSQPLTLTALPDIRQDPTWAAYRQLIEQFDITPYAYQIILSSSAQFLGLILQHYRPGIAIPPHDGELLRR